MELQRGGPGRVAMAFTFTGRGGEYFRIWITNIFLTILTLGIYSAWAKVRRNRYFYGNTRLGDSSFQYLAQPIAILKGRLIAVAAFVFYAVMTEIMPATAALFGLAFMGLMPWLAVKSLAFRARHTAFRNIRFDFKGSYGEAAKVFIVLPLLIVFTLGAIYPFILWRQKRFVIEHHAYGDARFAFAARVGAFYRIYGKILLLAIVGGLAIATTLFPIHRTLGLIALPLLALVLFAYGTARLQNVIYNGTVVADHGFHSNLDPVQVFMLYLTNMLGIVLTLGLFTPWAQVRLARYRAEHLRFLPAGDLDSFIARETESVGGTGEEMGEFFDVDVAI